MATGSGLALANADVTRGGEGKAVSNVSVTNLPILFSATLNAVLDIYDNQDKSAPC